MVFRMSFSISRVPRSLAFYAKPFLHHRYVMLICITLGPKNRKIQKLHFVSNYLELVFFGSVCMFLAKKGLIHAIPDLDVYSHRLLFL